MTHCSVCSAQGKRVESAEGAIDAGERAPSAQDDNDDDGDDLGQTLEHCSVHFIVLRYFLDQPDLMFCVGK